jgi:hypothetical protein
MWEKKHLSGLFAVLAASLVVVMPAWAGGPDPILSFQFTDMDGDFVAGLPGTGTFSSNDQAATAGDVTRLVPLIATADYDQGYVGGIADVNITMNLTGITPNSATGLGTFFVTDADGDSITGSVSGTWFALPGAASFLGNLFNVFINDNGVQDGMFNGPSGGAFSLAFAATPPLTGAIIQLSLPDHWFSVGSFNNANTSVNSQIIPEPSSLVLALGLAALAARRRRAA